MAPKKKKLTQREKALRAQAKKELQEEGVLPPDKPKLNRKKFARDTIAQWESTEGPLYAYVMSAIVWTLPSKEQRRPVTPEQVGALKVLKISLAIKQFEDALPEGTCQYKTYDMYQQVIKPIIEL